jgi:hypothetical protein
MLRNKAVLVIPTGGSTEYVFEFSDGFELTRQVSKSFVMAGRGQYIDLVFDFVEEIDAPDSSQRRRGYHLELGGGEWTREASFETGQEDIRWGDGEGGTGPDNVTTTDASGQGVHKEDRADVLEYVVAKTRTDSETFARLHYNQWTDGRFGDAGAHGRPMPVAIDADGLSITTDTQKPTSVEGTVNMVHLARLPAEVTDAANQVLSEVQDFA